ncbi:MAG: isoprenyl transferase [Bdellovibrionales bacterium]|jgi:undecaprenyl diphosphate synthase|nr:isoprenyl transferase [Bdellovibrionales bacterium]
MSQTDTTATLPRHVAIIMDGNGRWAAARGLTRIEGHKKGAEAAQRAVEAARDLGIRYVTLFGFSSENWNRPALEVEGLMGLLRYYLKKETESLHKNGAALRVIGDRSRLPQDIVEMIAQAEDITKNNTELTVVIALSYGGRQDIAFAAREIARAAAVGKISPDAISEDVFATYLMTAGIPDPDLMIRTSGENRISNFLLWQLAYAEMYFTNTLWPDFSRVDMEAALAFFAGRERRYGGLPPCKTGQTA